MTHPGTLSWGDGALLNYRLSNLYRMNCDCEKAEHYALEAYDHATSGFKSKIVLGKIMFNKIEELALCYRPNIKQEQEELLRAL